MLQKNRVDALTNLHDSTESKGQVGNTTRNLHIRALLLDRLDSVDKIHSVVGVLFHTSANGQHVGIKHNVFRWEMNLIHKDVITALADAHLL